MLRYCLTLLLLILAGGVFLLIETDLNGQQVWRILLGDQPRSFAEIELSFSRLPRLAMAVMVGAAMGLTGSLLQQLTRNPLLSPITLGVSSGAWLALIVISVWFPALSADHSALFAMLGALLATTLVILIAGIRNLSGLPVVLAGMAVNILLGAITSAIVLFKDQYARELFIWGAGDLSQNGWDSVVWLAPRLSAGLVILIVAPRVLSLLKLGHRGAAARGLSVAPLFLILCVLALWVVAASVTAIGVIGFIGLLTPNIARILGARLPRDELCYSLLLGALLLTLTDALALWFSQFTAELIPSGTTAALIGAPALIWLSRRRIHAQDQISFRIPQGFRQLQPVTLGLLASLFLTGILASILITQTDTGWLLLWPDEFSWSLRWPRIVAAISAGAAIAVSGTVLQRLIHNPLASPDLLGMSAGAVCALVLSALFLGKAVNEFGPLIAFAGSLTVLLILLLLNRHHGYAPAPLILSGIALAAMIEALVQFALIKGTDDVYSILSWLSGSTYRISGQEALLLAAASAVLITAVCAAHRGLTLISLDRGIALGRGLNLSVSFIVLLIAAALLSALVASLMGPLAFVGLLAPHMAAMLGARQALQQLWVSLLLGASLILFADWLGQNLIYPVQIAAGTLASVLGASYFILLQIQGARRASRQY